MDITEKGIDSMKNGDRITICGEQYIMLGGKLTKMIDCLKGKGEKLILCDFSHMGRLPHEYTENTRYTVKCKKCERMSGYKIKCTSVKEIMCQDVLERIIKENDFYTDETRTWHNIVNITEDDINELDKNYGGYHENNRYYVSRHKCQHCDSFNTLYVIQNW